MSAEAGSPEHRARPLRRDTTRSQELFARCCRIMPGGVNSPVRAFRGVGGDPLFLVRGKGAYVWDVDGNRYLDYLASWGPLILGHAADTVLEAVYDAAAHGTSFGAPTPHEMELATLICERVPSIEQVRLVSSGTEAVMSALRLARAFTGRSKILKFEGGYHGHSDALLAKAGSGIATLGIPDTPGVPPAVVADTVTVPYNDLSAVEQVFRLDGSSFAAVIVEPVAGNMGVVPPTEGFLEGLRSVTARHGTLLIFDEVITGFRVGPGGAQELFGVMPDLTTLGKVVGGGFPLAAYGGREEILQMIAPAGPVYQAGTLSGNPVAVCAGIATLQALDEPSVYEGLERAAGHLEMGLRRAAEAAGVLATVNRVGSMLTTFFTAGPVTDYASAKRSDTAAYGRYFHGMLDESVYLAPSQFEAAFVSTAHSEVEIEQTVEAARCVLRASG